MSQEPSISGLVTATCNRSRHFHPVSEVRVRRLEKVPCPRAAAALKRGRGWARELRSPVVGSGPRSHCEKPGPSLVGKSLPADVRREPGFAGWRACICRVCSVDGPGSHAP